jgi:hypothetical protein
MVGRINIDPADTGVGTALRVGRADGARQTALKCEQAVRRVAENR